MAQPWGPRLRLLADMIVVAYLESYGIGRLPMAGVGTVASQLVE